MMNMLELTSEKNWQHSSHSSLSVRLFLFLMLCLGMAHGLSLVVISYSDQDASQWLALILLGELLLLVPCVWFVARQAVRPLAQLAHAANAMTPGKKSAKLLENGPAELAHAAKAFNAMQDRILDYTAKRAQALGAISHDLKTPITRMRLRTEAMEQSVGKEKLTKDLCEMERLVCDGLAYARSGDDITRPLCRVDLNDFLDSLVCDYRDIGKNVRMKDRCMEALTTHPDTLRRIVVNLVDNALKYSGAAEIVSYRRQENSVSIFILDRGKGIPRHELDAVLQPFYRLESSCDDKPDGSGLGLAIAHQLASAIGASLILSNRAGGGLSAEIRLCSAKAHLESHVEYAPHSQGRPSPRSLAVVVL